MADCNRVPADTSRVCRVVSLRKSVYSYQSSKDDQLEEAALREKATPEKAFRKLMAVAAERF